MKIRREHAADSLRPRRSGAEEYLRQKFKGPGLAVQWMEVEEPEFPLLGDRWLIADFPKALDEELRLSHNHPD